MTDYKKAFENTIVDLCHSIGKDEIRKLDNILTQEKSEFEIFKDIIPKTIGIVWVSTHLSRFDNPSGCKPA